MISATTMAYGSRVRRQGRSRPLAAYQSRTFLRKVRSRLRETGRGADPPGFPRPKGRPLIAGGVDTEAAIRFFAGTPGGQFVALDQLMLEAAHVGVLGRQLDHAVGRLGATDALQGLLKGGLGRIGGLQGVQLAQSALDLG